MTWENAFFLFGVAVLAYVLVRGLWRPPRIQHPADRPAPTDIGGPPVGGF
jgi:hypothetical protein